MGGLVLLLFLGTLVYAIAEELTLTTYYPSPRGVYHELRTQGDVKLGDISASTPKARLEIRGRTALTSEKTLYVGNVDGDPRFVVQDNGNVGIGTAIPGVKLDVAGMVRGTDLDCPDCLTASDIAPDAVGAAEIAANAVGDSELFDGGVWNLSAPLALMGANVGIGTASPTAKLEVAGQVKITGGLPGAGKVLVSDASGLASWQGPPQGAQFGGMYSTNEVCAAGGTSVNPLTGGQSCPAGFSAQRVATATGPGGNCHIVTWVCWKEW